MRLRWVVMFLLLAAIILIAAAPIISVIVAGTIAESNGCVLHEGLVNPCIVDGEDIGSRLYKMFVLGWLMLVTVPLGLVLLVIWIVVAIVMVIAGRLRKPPLSAPPTAAA